MHVLGEWGRDEEVLDSAEPRRSPVNRSPCSVATRELILERVQATFLERDEQKARQGRVRESGMCVPPSRRKMKKS